MSSIIEGYNYDIFISYRQKDNKGDRWVSEFVEALKTELESTFKEEISVYFDINPHDGLLETHDVDASLKDKLKCLVFIPIISRTYCDPKSFAWEHEFKAFVEQASKDQFGLKIKLTNGNVASRVLPVRIHDLDNADIKLCESVLGGVLRGVEFIYKEPGINKPLSPEDDDKKNLNGTKYRLQINKTANAIKEIVSGLKTGSVGLGSEMIQLNVAEKEIDRETNIEEYENPVKLKVIKLLSGFLITAILVMAAILVYPKIFRHNKLENLRSSEGRISVAVMPFQNMTNDTIWNVWQEGIQNNVITVLSTSEELKVRQIESITGLLQSKGLTNYNFITPSIASNISQKLDASILIYGSINQAGSKLRLNAQLIDSKTEETLKPFQIEGSATEKEIFHIIDSLSLLIKNYLIISKFKNESRSDFQQFASTNSPEAYRYFVYGNNAFYKLDFPSACYWLLQAINVDSNFVGAMAKLSYAYGNQGLTRDAVKWCLNAYRKKNLASDQQKLYVNLLYASFFDTPNEELKYETQLLQIDDQLPIIYFRRGLSYSRLHQYDKAITEYEKALEIYNKWAVKPAWIMNYTDLGEAYHQTFQSNKEKKLYKRAEEDFPDNTGLIYRQAVLALSEGKTKDANAYIEKYKSIRKENSASEADITTDLASLYSEAGILDKAEGYYRQTLILEPENPVRMNYLAWFLIDKDRNINEGMELVEKALKLQSDNYSFLNNKGWGLYKQGKYQEALNVLQKSWDSRMKNYDYNLDVYLHLEAAKKAVEDKKNN